MNRGIEEHTAANNQVTEENNKITAENNHLTSTINKQNITEYIEMKEKFEEMEKLIRLDPDQRLQLLREQKNSMIRLQTLEEQSNRELRNENVELTSKVEELQKKLDELQPCSHFGGLIYICGVCSR